MQFNRNTSVRQPKNIFKFIVKISLICISILAVIILINKIEFPSPNKKIEKSIPNANLKIVK